MFTTDATGKRNSVEKSDGLKSISYEIRLFKMINSKTELIFVLE